MSRLNYIDFEAIERNRAELDALRARVSDGQPITPEERERLLQRVYQMHGCYEGLLTAVQYAESIGEGRIAVRVRDLSAALKELGEFRALVPKKGGAA